MTDPPPTPHAPAPNRTRCPSTHCERAQECRSPNECIGTGRVAPDAPAPWPAATALQAEGGWRAHCDFLATIIRTGGSHTRELYPEQVEAVLYSPPVMAALRAERDEAQPVAFVAPECLKQLDGTRYGIIAAAQGGEFTAPLYAHPPATSPGAEPADSFGAHILTGVLGSIGGREIGPGHVVLSEDRYRWLLQHVAATSPGADPNALTPAERERVLAAFRRQRERDAATSPGAAGDAAAELQKLAHDYADRCGWPMKEGGFRRCHPDEIAKCMMAFAADVLSIVPKPAPAAEQGARERALEAALREARRMVEAHVHEWPQQGVGILQQIDAALRSRP
jgi:hypothetical protein